MKIEKIEIMNIKIPFKIKFNHFLKSRSSTENIILKISSEKHYGLGEAIPREYVTGETIEKIIQTLNTKLLPDLKKKEFKRMEEVINYLAIYSKNMKKDELSAFACFSDAILNLTAQEFNFGIDDVLKYLKIEQTKKIQIKYSAIIGESNIVSTLIKAAAIKLKKFENVKIKISPKTLNQLPKIRKILKKQNIYVDANCSFDENNIDELITILKKTNITLIEQPFAIDNEKRYEIYSKLKSENIKVILDESFCLEKDLNKITKEGDIVNLRINKNAGIITTLVLYKKLCEKECKIILGCMVGETILTRYNLILSKKLDTIYNEGNYDTYLFKKIIIENPKFEKNGILDINKLDFNINNQINLNNDVDKYLIGSKSYLN